MSEVIVIDGEANVKKARILALRSALKLEIVGLKGRFNAFQIVKKEFGFKGSKAKVLEQLNKHIDTNILVKAS